MRKRRPTFVTILLRYTDAAKMRLVPVVFVGTVVAATASDVTSREGPSSLLDALLRESGAASDLPAVAVKQVAAAALEKASAEEGLPQSELACVRDYSGTCPSKWVDEGDGTHCSAPAPYAGPCPSSVRFGGASPLEKSRMAARCGALFPCVGGCVEDFSAQCPASWVQHGQECVAPSTYSFTCVGRERFASLSPGEKEAWARACDVSWPCRAPRQERAAEIECAMDFAASPCPSGWRAEAGDCRAPPDYKGPCAYSYSLDRVSTEGKQAFARVCAAPWPCA